MSAKPNDKWAIPLALSDLLESLDSDCRISFGSELHPHYEARKQRFERVRAEAARLVEEAFSDEKEASDA